MKEEEAKLKWCPNYRLSGINERGVSNANRGNFNEVFCIGSDCMMWESWEYVASEHSTAEGVQNKDEGDCGLKTKELNCNI